MPALMAVHRAGYQRTNPVHTLTRKEISALAPADMLAKDTGGKKYSSAAPPAAAAVDQKYKKKMGKAVFATVDLAHAPTPVEALAPVVHSQRGAPPGDWFPSLSNFTFDVKKVNKVMAAAC